MGSVSLMQPPHRAHPVSGLRTDSSGVSDFKVGCFQVIFSADQTHELMFCLEELTSSLSSAAPGTDRPVQVRNSSRSYNYASVFPPKWLLADVAL